LYNNTPAWLLLEADVFAVLLMNELKNFTYAVIGQLGKLVHQQNCSHYFFFNYNIISVQVKYITIEIKEVTVYNGFLIPHDNSGEGRHTEKEIRYIQYGPLLLFQ
jgi:hypothetical protein